MTLKRRLTSLDLLTTSPRFLFIFFFFLKKRETGRVNQEERELLKIVLDNFVYFSFGKYVMSTRFE